MRRRVVDAKSPVPVVFLRAAFSPRWGRVVDAPYCCVQPRIRISRPRLLARFRRVLMPSPLHGGLGVTTASHCPRSNQNLVSGFGPEISTTTACPTGAAGFRRANSYIAGLSFKTANAVDRPDPGMERSCSFPRPCNPRGQSTDRPTGPRPPLPLREARSGGSP